MSEGRSCSCVAMRAYITQPAPPPSTSTASPLSDSLWHRKRQRTLDRQACFCNCFCAARAAPVHVDSITTVTQPVAPQGSNQNRSNGRASGLFLQLCSHPHHHCPRRQHRLRHTACGIASSRGRQSVRPVIAAVNTPAAPPPSTSTASPVSLSLLHSKAAKAEHQACVADVVTQPAPPPSSSTGLPLSDSLYHSTAAITMRQACSCGCCHAARATAVHVHSITTVAQPIA